jgi:hypothetical protein
METTRLAHSVIGQIAVTDLTGRPAADELSLTLTQAPAYGLKWTLPDAGVRYVLLLGQALGRRALMDLLYTVAPYKAHGLDRFARVLDNWGIHDRAAANNGSQGLFMQHAASLKLSWEVFTEHRDLYMAIFRDQTESTRAVPILTWEKGLDNTRRWRFEPPEPRLVEALKTTAPVLQTPADGVEPQLDTVLGLVSLPYFLPELRRHWPAWQPLVKGGKSNYIGPASVPVLCLMHRRALLNSVLIKRAEQVLDAG